MVEHSPAYQAVKQQIIACKNGQVHIATPLPINHDQAIYIFRGVLHDTVNTAYLSDPGITEAEANILHNLIENVESPDV